MNTINIQQNLKTKGVYILTRAYLEKPEHFALEAYITKVRNEINDLVLKQESTDSKSEARRLDSEIQSRQQIFISSVRELNTICKTTKEVVNNIVPTVGRAMIANNLGNSSPTNVMYAKYIELGSGTNTPANSDTALQTSSYRNAVASRTNASNVAYVTGFFNATETSGTYREAGIFSDGTASAGTGVLVSRVAINVTKTTSNTLTIDWTLTIS
jgi:hypothetical protein